MCLYNRAGFRGFAHIWASLCADGHFAHKLGIRQDYKWSPLESNLFLEVVERSSSLIGVNGDVRVISSRDGITISRCKNGFESVFPPTDCHIHIRGGPGKHSGVALGVKEEETRAEFCLEDPDLWQIAVNEVAHRTLEMRLNLSLNVFTKTTQQSVHAIHSIPHRRTSQASVCKMGNRFQCSTDSGPDCGKKEVIFSISQRNRRSIVISLFNCLLFRFGPLERASPRNKLPVPLSLILAEHISTTRTDIPVE